MFSSKKWASLFALMIVASLILSACATPTPEVIEKVVEKVVTQIVKETVKETVIVEGTPEIVEKEVTKIVEKTIKETVVVEKEVAVEVEVTPTPLPEPVTNDGYSTTDIPTLDPQMGEDVVSINYIENLFVHLTNYDLETAAIVPEAATEWDISDDGLVYTFKIRTDIPWVYHNPATGETTQEVDDDGNPRFLTASDFVYGIKRACDPNIGSYYSSVIAPQLKGCSDVLFAEDPEDIPEELWDAIGVSAPSDDELVIELEFAASYFLSMTPMWTLAAVPQWAIEEFEDNWIEAGNIVTNGRYVLDEWIHNVRRTILRNPLMPADMVQFADETIQVPDLAVFYFSFRMTKPPFDDARVRRAFSAAFDRETYINDVKQGQGLVMTHFAPPGIFGAPPIDEVGIPFDPDFAREQLAEAGYPDCEGFPQVTLLGYSGQSTLNWIEFAQANWEEVLGCSADIIKIEQQPFRELLAATSADTPDEEAPHMWTLGWGPDYADENNWVGDVLWCENPDNRQKRECNEIDDLIVAAREESDPDKRIEMYRQIEEMFFGYEGEIPFFPQYVRIAFVAEHSWLDRIPALFGGQQWYNWTIDQAAKQAAQ
jgi:oligopeptide transport system substrate-binding protein